MQSCVCLNVNVCVSTFVGWGYFKFREVRNFVSEVKCLNCSERCISCPLVFHKMYSHPLKLLVENIHLGIFTCYLDIHLKKKWRIMFFFFLLTFYFSRTQDLSFPLSECLTPFDEIRDIFSGDFMSLTVFLTTHAKQELALFVVNLQNDDSRHL